MLRTGEATARLEGSRQELFDIITDFESYPSWVPGLESCHVLTREGDVTVAEAHASRWLDRSFTLELIQSPPSAVELRRIDSLDPFELAGWWQLGRTDHAADGASVEVSVRLRLATPLFGFGIRRRMREELRATLDALGDRCRHLASHRTTETPRKHKILEITPERRGLKVWYMGETFLLPRLEEPRDS